MSSQVAHGCNANVPTLSHLRFEEFQPIAEWILSVEAVEAREVGIPPHLDTCGGECVRQRLHIADVDARMGLARRREVGLDTEIGLEGVATEPAAGGT